MSSLDPHRLAPDRAMQLAAMAVRRCGIEEPVEPLRIGGNHVFRAGDVVVRVAPQSADVSSQVALARWLASEGFAVAAPLAGPDVVDGAKVSLWECIHADEGRPSSRSAATRPGSRSTRSSRRWKPPTSSMPTGLPH